MPSVAPNEKRGGEGGETKKKITEEELSQNKRSYYCCLLFVSIQYSIVVLKVMEGDVSIQYSVVVFEGGMEGDDAIIWRHEIYKKGGNNMVLC